MPESRDGKVAVFEAMYLRLAPKMRRIAVRNFGVPLADADEIVQDIFAIYFLRADEVENVGKYLLAQLCTASRRHLAPPGAEVSPYCGETPCLARRQAPPQSS
jgi:hypothetical protein